MGLIVSVYRDADLRGDCSNGGFSSRFTKLTLVNVEGPFDPTDDAPAALLVKREHGNVVVVDPRQNGRWTMFGGNFVSCSDSRFHRAVEALSGYDFGFPVAVHDRVE
jgi:hypothetical protein